MGSEMCIRDRCPGCILPFAKIRKAERKRELVSSFSRRILSKTIKDNIKMRAIVRVCTQRLPNRFLSSAKIVQPAGGAKFFLSVAALEYLGKIRINGCKANLFPSCRGEAVERGTKVRMVPR